MIFAELEYPGHYVDVHHELLAFVRTRFADVESGLQGDSWIWITEGGEKVALDTFSSMRHQVKASKPGRHVDNVINAIKEKYKIRIYEEPEWEAHDDVEMPSVESISITGPSSTVYPPFLCGIDRSPALLALLVPRRVSCGHRR